MSAERTSSEVCALTIVEELIAAGVREAVLAPGSRSAPLAYALHGADAAGLLRLHVRIDERTAGFLALGLSRAGTRPAAVVTTSGTAAANLHPAVLEAYHSGAPLVAITADRPPRLTNSGANQTTDQHRLFGVHLRGFAALDASGDRAGWRFEMRRLLSLASGARTRSPGPVQLNVAFDSPLVPAGPPPDFPRPDEPRPDEPRPGQPRPGQPGSRQPWPAPPVPSQPELPRSGLPQSRPDRDLLSHAVLPAGPRTVVVAGDLPPAAGRALAGQAEAARAPLLAEPSSNARSGAAAIRTYRILLRSSLAERVERVVVFGRPTLSRPVNALLARRDVAVAVVSDRADWVDPGLRGVEVYDAVDLEPGDPAWLAAWHAADTEVGVRVDNLIAQQPLPTGPALAARLWAATPTASPLVVGSSNPVRDLDLAALRVDPPDVYANRGLAGIDGTVSTAAGVALATGRPTVALVGDLTFLHDLTGLVIGQQEPRPDLRLVVANDDGGSIFATLEQGRPELTAQYERLFGTPHHARLEALADGLGARYVSAGEELERVFSAPPQGVEVVEVAIDRRHRRELDAAIGSLAASL